MIAHVKNHIDLAVVCIGKQVAHAIVRVDLRYISASQTANRQYQIIAARQARGSANTDLKEEAASLTPMSPKIATFVVPSEYGARKVYWSEVTASGVPLLTV